VPLGAASNVDTYRMPFSSEGGNIQATTDGVCFTSTRQRSFNLALNSQSSLEDLQSIQGSDAAATMRLEWREWLGCEDVLYLYDITNDGTGHLDMLFKATSDSDLLVAEYNAAAPDSLNGPRMDANAALLLGYTRPSGGAFAVRRIPMAGSYASTPFTYLNSVLLVSGGRRINMWPTSPYVTANEEAAARAWAEALPEWQHVPINAHDLSILSGALHCVVRNVPAAAPQLWVGDGVCNHFSGTCSPPPGTGGYSRECTPGMTSRAERYAWSGFRLQKPVCWGPEWQCPCAFCDEQAGCESYT